MRLPDRIVIASPSSGAKDGRGNPVVTWDWDQARREPAVIRPLSSDEDALLQQTVVSRWRVTLLAKTSATATSRVRWRDVEFEVDGDVEPHTDSRGRVHHHSLLLRRVAG